jgi:protein TonB
MRSGILVVLIALLACGDGSAPPGEGSGPTERGFQPPVATNAQSPVAYPPALFDDGVEGTVVLRLYVTEQGVIVPDSTQLAEGSGSGALDSAALAGVAAMRFAPAKRDGATVATAFLQPIQFRIPDGSPQGG